MYGSTSIATSVAMLCTDEQICAIRDLSAKLRIDENEVSQSLFDSTYDYLSRRGADDVIRELENRLEAKFAK